MGKTVQESVDLMTIMGKTFSYVYFPTLTNNATTLKSSLHACKNQGCGAWSQKTLNNFWRHSDTNCTHVIITQKICVKIKGISVNSGIMWCKCKNIMYKLTKISLYALVPFSPVMLFQLERKQFTTLSAFIFMVTITPIPIYMWKMYNFVSMAQHCTSFSYLVF